MVIRTDQWLFCQDYGVTIQIKALDPVTVKEVRVTAKFYPSGVDMGIFRSPKSTWSPLQTPSTRFIGGSPKN